MHKPIKFIYAALIVTLIGGVVAIELTRQLDSIDNQSQLAIGDPACNGQANKYFDLGFGIEHMFTGNIKEGMPVEVVLSCDHESFKIKGSVEQNITLEGLEKIDPVLNHNYELADFSSGDLVVDVNSDYNLDGYNDLSSLAINGSQLKSVLVFLYNPTSSQFEYNHELSSIPNIGVDKDKKLIESYTCGWMSDKDCKNDQYKWVNGYLEPVGTSTLLTEAPSFQIESNCGNWERYTSKISKISLWRIVDCTDDILQENQAGELVIYDCTYYKECNLPNEIPKVPETSYVKIKLFNKDKTSLPENILKKNFVDTLQLTGLQKGNQCTIRPLKIDSPYKLSPHKTRYEINISDEDWITYKKKFGTDIPELPCGRYGMDPDGYRYFEFDDRSPAKYIFVNADPDPIFDPETIRF